MRNCPAGPSAHDEMVYQHPTIAENMYNCLTLEKKEGCGLWLSGKFLQELKLGT